VVTYQDAMDARPATERQILGVANFGCHVGLLVEFAATQWMTPLPNVVGLTFAKPLSG